MYFPSILISMAVQINGKQEYLGIFATEDEVSETYLSPFTVALPYRLLWLTTSAPWKWVEWIV
jgi:hypothetical protein